ncbi:MAG TPA: Gfo/Idh/MocA family oxidoreductase, partial [Vicinamibacterales bacterium]|nr:Gfo/Idh/MocA family oxidoreductase [Vicinamibacterales bacterium]
MASRVSRRSFLQAGAAAAASLTTGCATVLPRHVVGATGQPAPSDKLNIALIGAGGQGRTNARALFKLDDAQIVAIADPAAYFGLERFYYRGMAGREAVRDEIEQHYAAKTPNFRCSEYEDFREMLDKEKGIDAVLCATPDHLHAYVCARAMRAGKHVYCEKPLTHNVWEARYIARLAKETGVATQLGNQGHSTDTIRETVEMIRDGAIGPVRQVHAWVGAQRWNPTLSGRPIETPPVPAGLNWDLWLGPRESRPFHPAYFPVAWRDFWAFGGGNIEDFGCHDLDSACWALDLAAPTSVEFHPAGLMDAEIVPYGCVGYYQFGARGAQPPVTVTWYDGGLRPPIPEGASELPARGVLFVGDKGSIVTGAAGAAARLLPQSLAESYKKPAPTIPRSKGHHRDWVDACKGGPPASSNFEYGARLTELALLGALALRTKRRIDWDAEGMKARGFAEAD